MTPDEYVQLAKNFKDSARLLRLLGESFAPNRCSAVLFIANLAASYADHAANLVEDQIAAMEISAVAQEEVECSE